MRSRCLRVEIADRCFARPMINPRYKASLFHAFYYNYTCRRVLSARYSQVINLVARLLSYLLSLFFFPFLFFFLAWSLTLQWEKKTRSLIRLVDSLTRGKKCFVKFVIFPLYIYRYCVLNGDSGYTDRACLPRFQSILISFSEEEDLPRGRNVTMLRYSGACETASS